MSAEVMIRDYWPGDCALVPVRPEQAREIIGVRRELLLSLPLAPYRLARTLLVDGRVAAVAGVDHVRDDGIGAVGAAWAVMPPAMPLAAARAVIAACRAHLAEAADRWTLDVFVAHVPFGFPSGCRFLRALGFAPFAETCLDDTPYMVFARKPRHG